MKAIAATEVKALLDGNEDVLLVNTLKAESFEKTRIPSAVNISLDDEDFVARVEEEAGGKAKPVMVYCASQECKSSEKAAENLEDAGSPRLRTSLEVLKHGRRIRRPSPSAIPANSPASEWRPLMRRPSGRRCFYS